MNAWKENLEESKKNYLNWWKGEGIVLSMWEHTKKNGAPHANIPKPTDAKDLTQFWFDPKWRAENLDYQLSRSSFKADILPVANTHLGPGSLAALMGAELEGGEDTIWIRHKEGTEMKLEFDENDPAWKLHLDLLKACKAKSKGNYYVGCPDLVEGLDVLASIKGTQDILMDMIMNAEGLEEQLQKVNDVYFKVFDQIYDVIQEDGEMAFCYFSIWGPGKVSKLQSDISAMISVEDYDRFVLPFIKEQCQKIDYTLYHLDGVDAQRHLDSILSIDELNAIQWTPGIGEPQGGDPCWYDLYKKILSNGKSVMANWVTLDELEPLIDNLGTDGLHINVDFKTEDDIEAAIKIVEKYR